MIDALFGSKTRVKLLHLFLNNPGQSFYVREITRKIDEQINSVRRELSNMMDVGIVTCDNSDNKLFYKVNQRNEYFLPLRAIFSDEPSGSKKIRAFASNSTIQDYCHLLQSISSLRLAVFSGVLVKDSSSSIDTLLVGDVPAAKVKAVMKEIERGEGREINYCVLPYDEFYYRLSIRDKFITEILDSKHAVVIDKENILTK